MHLIFKILHHMPTVMNVSIKIDPFEKKRYRIAI